MKKKNKKRDIKKKRRKLDERKEAREAKKLMEQGYFHYPPDFLDKKKQRRKPAGSDLNNFLNKI